MINYEKNDAAVFPLGGIGAGSIGLRGNGALCQWEIFNRPDRCTINPFSHFAVKAEQNGKTADWRVLQGDFSGGCMGEVSKGKEVWVYGNGVDRGTMAGVRHFESCAFSAFYPIAKLDFSDRHFPAGITMRALSPFIPSDSKNSSLPAAMFDIEITNTGDTVTDYTAAFSVNNICSSGRKNEHRMIGGTHAMHFFGEFEDKDSPDLCNMTVAAPDGEVSYQEHWYRGGWFDELCTFIRDFSSTGALKNRTYGEPWQGYTDVGTIASKITLAPGESRHIRFILCWYAPNIEKYWDPRRQRMKNYYSTMFSSSADAAKYCLENYSYLWETTKLFADTMEDQALPLTFREAIQGNLAIMKSTTCLRLEDGTLWGWEGVTEKSGSCEGSCTHVWNYAYSFAFLFPDLERSIHNAEFAHSIDCDGKMAFRTMLPLGSPMSNFRACVDGQMGTVIKLYRDWMISGDGSYIADKWEKIKSIISYAWSDKNPDRWDDKKTGLLSGRCHHTLDMELFGASSWLEGYYLGALRAAAEMAKSLGDIEAQKEYEELYTKGKALCESELFKGGYYRQNIDLHDKSIPDAYEMGELLNSDGYWNSEAGEIKYQIGDGCAITAVAADWMCRICGPGEVFDAHRRKATLEAIYKNNSMSMRDIDNSCRIYALDDEKGTVICSWKSAETVPAIPLTYAEECMSGFEYALAAQMIQDGMIKEAEEITAAVRERYNGERRDPWAEAECGASYARSMASYTLLPAYSGFEADMRKSRRMMGFHPAEYGKYFWSLDGAWGYAECERDRLTINVLFGTLQLKALRYTCPLNSLSLSGTPVSCSAKENGEICFDITLNSGDSLTAEIK